MVNLLERNDLKWLPCKCLLFSRVRVRKEGVWIKWFSCFSWFLWLLYLVYCKLQYFKRAVSTKSIRQAHGFHGSRGFHTENEPAPFSTPIFQHSDCRSLKLCNPSLGNSTLKFTCLLLCKNCPWRTFKVFLGVSYPGGGEGRRSFY